MMLRCDQHIKLCIAVFFSSFYLSSSRINFRFGPCFGFVNCEANANQVFCVCVLVFVLRSFGTMTSTDSDHIAMFVCRCCPHSFEREIKKKNGENEEQKREHLWMCLCVCLLVASVWCSLFAHSNKGFYVWKFIKCIWRRPVREM